MSTPAAVPPRDFAPTQQYPLGNTAEVLLPFPPRRNCGQRPPLRNPTQPAPIAFPDLARVNRAHAAREQARAESKATERLRQAQQDAHRRGYLAGESRGRMDGTRWGAICGLFWGAILTLIAVAASNSLLLWLGGGRP